MDTLITAGPGNAACGDAARGGAPRGGAPREGPPRAGPPREGPPRMGARFGSVPVDAVREPAGRTGFESVATVSGCRKQLAQYIGKNTAVPVVIDFDGGIDA